MKATLEFNLPEDQIEFNRANKSLDITCALFDILQLRKKLEREEEGNMTLDSEGVFEGIDRMANGISDILEEHNININKLIE